MSAVVGWGGGGVYVVVFGWWCLGGGFLVGGAVVAVGVVVVAWWAGGVGDGHSRGGVAGGLPGRVGDRRCGWRGGGGGVVVVGWWLAGWWWWWGGGGDGVVVVVGWWGWWPPPRCVGLVRRWEREVVARPFRVRAIRQRLWKGDGEGDQPRGSTAPSRTVLLGVCAPPPTYMYSMCTLGKPELVPHGYSSK